MNLEKLEVPLELANAGFNAALGLSAAGVTALVGAIGLAIKTTFDWANDLDSLGDVVDGTTDQIAAMAYVARKSGVGVATLTKASLFMEKGLLKTDGTLDSVGKKLKEFGIDVKYANGQVKTQATLTDEVSKRYSTFATQQEKVNFLTEVFGKQGAELVDFFDTLASEGGISAVEKKVKALGLAIDPTRYEQFNRNLEELKLIGVGLAVSFTEKVMPALERFLGWITANVPLWSDKFNAFKDNVISIFETKFLPFWDEKVKPKLQDFQIWLNTHIPEWKQEFKDFSADVQSAIRDDVIPALQDTETWVEKLIAKTIDLHTQWKNGGQISTNYSDGISIVASTLADLWAILEDVYGIGKAVLTLIINFFNPLKNAGQAAGEANKQFGLMNAIIMSLGSVFLTWKTNIDNARKALDWLLAVLNKIVDTELNLNIPLTGSGGGVNSGKASGGDVIAGQTYQVAEFDNPEIFTPAVNGRISKKEDAMGMNGAVNIYGGNWYVDKDSKIRKTIFQQVGA